MERRYSPDPVLAISLYDLIWNYPRLGLFMRDSINA
jgi:hypothetical protein